MQLKFERESLSLRYQEILQQNPLLQRLETELALIGWSEEEIRTAQLLIACASNASLTARLSSLESSFKVN